jgi:pimeloyl-ACP methyl ester carboxylesterase
MLHQSLGSNIYPTDLDGQLTYPDRLTMPSLGIGALGNGLLVELKKEKFVNPRLEHLPESGHYIAEEAPEQVAAILREFLRVVGSK